MITNASWREFFNLTEGNAMSVESIDQGSNITYADYQPLEGIMAKDKGPESCSIETTTNTNDAFEKFQGEGNLLQAAKSSQFVLVKGLASPEEFAELSRILSTPPSEEKDESVSDFIDTIICKLDGFEFSIAEKLQYLDELKICERAFKNDLKKTFFRVKLELLKLGTAPLKGDEFTRDVIQYLSSLSDESCILAGFNLYVDFLMNRMTEVYLGNHAYLEVAIVSADLLLDFAKKRPDLFAS